MIGRVDDCGRLLGGRLVEGPQVQILHHPRQGSVWPVKAVTVERGLTARGLASCKILRTTGGSRFLEWVEERANCGVAGPVCLALAVCTWSARGL